MGILYYPFKFKRDLLLTARALPLLVSSQIQILTTFARLRRKTHLAMIGARFFVLFLANKNNVINDDEMLRV